MPRSRAPHPAAFRQPMVDLVRSGRSPETLAKEFEPAAPAIRGDNRSTPLHSPEIGDHHGAHLRSR